MAKSRKKTRVSSKFDDLPKEVIAQVDMLLLNPVNSYTYISELLKSEGYEISRSAVCRYAQRSNCAAQRLYEAQLQTEKLVEVIKNNPDLDYTESAVAITMNGLVNRMATAEEEFDEMPLDKAGRLIASLTRTKVYKDRVRQDMQKKTDLAFKEMEESIMKVIKQDPALSEQLKTILNTAKERMIQDD